jgi:hypothetical protein
LMIGVVQGLGKVIKVLRGTSSSPLLLASQVS